jgi:hypothetical protein
MKALYKRTLNMQNIDHFLYKILFSKLSDNGNMPILLTFQKFGFKYIVKLFLCCLLFLFFPLKKYLKINMQRVKRE